MPGDGGRLPAVVGLPPTLVFILSRSLLRSRKSEFFFCWIGLELFGRFLTVLAETGDLALCPMALFCEKLELTVLSAMDDVRGMLALTGPYLN